MKWNINLYIINDIYKLRKISSNKVNIIKIINNIYLNYLSAMVVFFLLPPSLSGPLLAG